MRGSRFWISATAVMYFQSTGKAALMKRLPGLIYLLVMVLVGCGEGDTKPVESTTATPTFPSPDISAIK